MKHLTSLFHHEHIEYLNQSSNKTVFAIVVLGDTDDTRMYRDTNLPKDRDTFVDTTQCGKTSLYTIFPFS